jgi:hypothetical protein
MRSVTKTNNDKKPIFLIFVPQQMTAKQKCDLNSDTIDCTPVAVIVDNSTNDGVHDTKKNS